MLNLHTEVAETLIERGSAKIPSADTGGGDLIRRPGPSKAMTGPPENKMFSGQQKKTKNDDDII